VLLFDEGSSLDDVARADALDEWQNPQLVPATPLLSDEHVVADSAPDSYRRGGVASFRGGGSEAERPGDAQDHQGDGEPGYRIGNVEADGGEQR
jgi:hypothetical protein